MNLDCFTFPFLTVDGNCSGTGPGSSAVVLNALPGITLRRAAATANEEYVRGIEMIRTLEVEAVNDVCEDILSALQDEYQFKDTINDRVLGGYASSFRTAPAGEYVGMKIYKDYSQKHRYTRLKVEGLDIDVNEDTVAEVFFSLDGAAAISKSLVCKKDGINRFYFDDIEADANILVYWDPDGVEIGTSVTNTNTSSSCNGNCLGGCSCYGYTKIESADAVTWTENSSKSNGLILFVACKCEPSSLFCDHKDDIALAVRMKTGIYLLLELLASDRVHPIVQNQKEDAARILARWEGTIDPDTGFRGKGDYQVLIDRAVKQFKNSLRRGQGGDCFTCGGDNRLKTYINLP